MVRKYRRNFQIRITGIMVLLLFFLIPPDSLLNIGVMNELSIFLIGVMFLYLITITIAQREFNIFVIISFIFIIWRSFSSYYFSSGILDISNSLRVLTLVLLLNLSIKRFPKSTLKSLSFIFGFYIAINFLTLLIFPEGLYLDNPREGQFRPAWILGIENQFTVFLIPGIIILVLSSWYNHKKISILVWIQIVIAVLTILKIWSATAVVAVFFVVFSILINTRKKIKPLYSFSFLSIIYTILWIVLVRFNSVESFQKIFVDLLGKDLTLSGRTKIWSIVFETIPESVWYGFGNNTSVLAGVKTYFRAHNMILQILLDNGVIGLLLLIICIVIAGVKLQIFKNKVSSAVLLIGVFGLLIGGLTESFRINYLFLLLVLSYNVQFIIRSERLNLDKCNDGR